MTRLMSILLGALLLAPAPAWALCDSLADDTAEIQAMLDAGRATLPAGRCVISALTMPFRSILEGQGQSTILVGTVPGATLVTAGQWSVIRDIQIGLDATIALHAGIQAIAPLDGYGIDRIRLQNVVVVGQFTNAAFLCANAASSSISHSAFYSYNAASYVGIFGTRCSDWTLTQTEWHAIDQTGPGAGALWFTTADSVRMYGGNVSGNLTSGDPLWWLVNVQSSGSIILDGVTFYADWGPFPLCGVFIQGPPPHLRGNTMFVGQATC